MASLAPKTLLLLSLSGTLLLIACGGGAGEPPASQDAASAQEPASTQEASKAQEPVAPPLGEDLGRSVYLQACALCHGETGDGQGLVPLDRPARSFLEGGFSFGNTPKAVRRTVANGIGGTPMPGFATSLSPEEIEAVSAYVIALGPEQVQIAPGSTELQVTDRPRVVRGGFPPVRDGLAMTPRGLLLGGLDGMSFQYDAEDLRLLAVRQGGFVDRRDWGNRGGDSLEPLGKGIYLPEGGDPGAMWLRYLPDDTTAPVEARLVATEVLGGQAWVEYRLLLDGKAVAEVRETGEALSLGGWSGFRRLFEVRWLGVEKVPLDLAPPQGFPSTELFPEGGGTTLLVDDPTHGPTVFHRARRMAVHAQDRFTLTADTLFGLAATAENLDPLEELLP